MENEKKLVGYVQFGMNVKYYDDESGELEFVNNLNGEVMCTIPLDGGEDEAEKMFEKLYAKLDDILEDEKKFEEFVYLPEKECTH